MAIAPAAQSASISIQDFLKILTAQMNNQDPLKPVDNQEFVAQIAQFANLEQSRSLNNKVDVMLSLQSATQSVGLLGKTVDANVNGALVTGVVTTLTLASGEPVLTLRTPSGGFQENVAFSQIVNIR
jgi:flagellar basal-body rod modification protein FlgD